MNISRPNLNSSFEAYVDPANGLRGRVMTARPASDAAPPQVNEAGKVAQEAPSAGEVSNAVKTANALMKQMNVGIEFSFDEDAGEMIIKVIDAETRDVLRQFPSEEMIALSRAVEKMQAALVKQTA
jgi:flagellar protein FlaG